MGNSPSLLFGDSWWTNAQNNCDSASAIQDHASVEPGDDKKAPRELSEENKERLNEFKLELARKHEKRRQILEEKRKEMDELREEVVRLKKENEELKQASPKCDRSCEEARIEMERLRSENEKLMCILKDKAQLLETSDDIIEKNRELRVSIAGMQRELQHLNKQVIDFEKERQDYKTHVVALKDVIAVSKHMLQIRDSQLKELKEKIETIEQSLAERESTLLSQDLRAEYERQLQNIRNLRVLYEERQRVHKREKDELVSQLDDAKKELAEERTRVSELEERIKTLEDDNSKKYDEIKSLESNLGLSKAESRQYQAELTVINQLFSEILLGFNSSQDIDLDKLQKHLEDHRDLLQNIVVNEISPEVSCALPKVLLELLNQLDDEEAPKDHETVPDRKLETIEEESESQTSSVQQINSSEEIVENLPKVWKVLIELLSHQKPPTNDLTDGDDTNNPCYKTVQTPKGPSLVLSVSQTFIRLKNLILEKKSLEKETNHLKQLNGHLENRLQDQEKRLELVQTELSKTWHVVGKLQKQHQMLHTQEKILRYELAQKRKLLTELKEELEYSREKWTQAREKNSNTEQQWRQLRTEFASRRNTVTNDNSVESGYSDDRESSSSDEEPGYETDISECAQKASGSDDVEDLSETMQSATVLDLINGNMVEMVCQGSSNGVVVHSDEKTDSVPHEDSTEKTVPEANIEAVDDESKGLIGNVPESSLEIGTSKESVKTEEFEGSSETVEDKQLDEESKDDGEPAQQPERKRQSTLNIAGTSQEDNTSPESLKREDGSIVEVAGSQENKSSRSTVKEEVPTTALAGPSQENRLQPSFEEVLAQRDERLKNLEGQAAQLVTRVTNTANRSAVISNRLDDLHEVYGRSSSEINNDEVPSTDVDVRPTENNQE